MHTRYVFLFHEHMFTASKRQKNIQYKLYGRHDAAVLFDRSSQETAGYL